MLYLFHVCILGVSFFFWFIAYSSRLAWTNEYYTGYVLVSSTSIAMPSFRLYPNSFTGCYSFISHFVPCNENKSWFQLLTKCAYERKRKERKEKKNKEKTVKYVTLWNALGRRIFQCPCQLFIWFRAHVYAIKFQVLWIDDFVSIKHNKLMENVNFKSNEIPNLIRTDLFDGNPCRRRFITIIHRVHRLSSIVHTFFATHSL